MKAHAIISSTNEVREMVSENSKYARQRFLNLFEEVRDTEMHPEIESGTLFCSECGKTLATFAQEDGTWEYYAYEHYEDECPGGI